jgi:hypothetical protein
MSTSQQPFTEQINDIIDTIVNLTRPKHRADLSPTITPEERDEVMRKALKAYQVLSEKRIQKNGRILIEYQKNFQEITEEIKLT